MHLKDIRFTLSDLTDRDFYRTKKGQAVALCGALTGTGLAALFVIGNAFTTHSMLERMDENYADKCFSADESWQLSAYEAGERTDDILSLVAAFDDASPERVDLPANTLFCYGIDDESVSPTDHWGTRGVYFADDAYPDPLAAIFFHAAQKNAFWDANVSVAENLNEYTPESALIYSRFYRANQDVQDIRNVARSVSNYAGYGQSIGNDVWTQYLAEHPTHRSVVEAYLTALPNVGEDGAMIAAVQTYMQDAVASNEGDLAFLNTYVDHVRVLSRSSYEAIYDGNWAHSGEWAFVDADRDGLEDDAIKLNFRNRATQVHYDGYNDFGWRLSRQEEYIPDTCYDKNGNPFDCSYWDDVSETVYYDVIPAVETATVRLHPETLRGIAEVTGSPYLNADMAESFLETLVGGGEFTYAAPLSDEANELLVRIHGEIATNIPGRDVGFRAEGLGLN